MQSGREDFLADVRVVDVGGSHSLGSLSASSSRSERDSANNRKMVSMLRELSAESPARFVCAMCLATLMEGSLPRPWRVAGVIVTEPRGDNGFGYDPHLFIRSLVSPARNCPPMTKCQITPW